MSYERFKAECEERGPECAEFYESLISKGNNPGFAAMLAQQSPCGTKGTDRAFLEGSHSYMDTMWPDNRTRLLETAKKAGISTQGKIYKGGIGGPSDPMAWVSTRGDVLAACKAKGLTCSGSVNYKAPEPEPKKKNPLADDIRDTYVGKILATEPRTRERVKKNPKAIREVRERVVEKHGKK
tara:strand:+ start:990 stop:1535 length:546 start_codon:yes stop_codon:yes gene_type:complete